MNTRKNHHYHTIFAPNEDLDGAMCETTGSVVCLLRMVSGALTRLGISILRTLSA